MFLMLTYEYRKVRPVYKGIQDEQNDIPDEWMFLKDKQNEQKGPILLIFNFLNCNYEQKRGVLLINF